MKISHIAMTIIGILIVLFFVYDFVGIRTTVEGDLADINLPEGFSISLFADNLGDSSIVKPGPNAGPRFMTYYNDVLLVSLMRQGKVVALPDRNNDGQADEVITVAENLNLPHGLAVHDNKLYIAENHQVIKGSLNNLILGNTETVIGDLPEGGNHITRTIRINNNSLYVSIGSSCNVCYEENELRATVLKCNLTGECNTFATGLRNSVGIAFNPTTNELWGTENGRDLIGINIPPEEINLIEEGKDYGWPICYGTQMHDTSFDKNVYVRNPCEDTEAPIFEMQAHSAPLGLTFYQGDMFPDEYKGDLFVAYHGSWNRQPPTGYKIVRIKFENNLPTEIEDFASGWLRGLVVSGRPVDVITAPDGSLLVSDDSAGKIYRISYEN